MKLHDLKKLCRKQIKDIKKSYGRSALEKQSVAVMQRLEESSLFKDASCVALYYSLPDEVSTIDFIEKWQNKKQILLPVVDGDNLRFFLYKGQEALQAGAFGILEPDGDDSLQVIPDLVVVPGIAFDRERHRLGRGKGFYDRYLSKVEAKTIGIGFDFQLLENLPTEPFDQKMDMIITESETIGI